MRGVPWRISQVPGYQNSVFGSLSYNPATDRAVQQIREVGGIYSLGTRFPFANGSQDVIARNTSTETGPKVEADTYEINASQTVTAGTSPIWIACRRFKLNAGGILTADGLGGAGGSGASGVGDPGAKSYVNTSSYFGLGGGGGGGGSVAVGYKDGGAGGKGYAGGTNAAGGIGVTTAPDATAGDGTDGHVSRMGFDTLDTYIRLLNDSIGGAGGGGGGATGESVGGDGGAGGGIIIITCETFENLGTIRARGAAGAAGGGGSNKDPGGGGGGGAGGIVLVLCVQRIALGTIQVTGGAGGAGGVGSSGLDDYYGGAGGDGADGLEYFEQQYIL